jgi:hypothetical protein
VILLTAGSPLETVDNLPLSDAKLIFASHQLGFVGPSKDYHLAASTLQQGNAVQQAIYQSQNPKYKATPLPTLDEMFPMFEQLMSLSDEPKAQRNAEEDIAKQAAAALVNSGAPDWLKQAI